MENIKQKRKYKEGRKCSESTKQKLRDFYTIPGNREERREVQSERWKNNREVCIGGIKPLLERVERVRKGEIRSGFFGKTHSEETKQEMRERRKGRNLGRVVSEATRSKISEKLKGNTNGSCASSEARSRAMKLVFSRPEIIEQQRESHKLLWDDPEYRKKVRGKRSPSGLEKKFIEILTDSGLPYLYVGDFQLNIGRKFPDFVNEKGTKLIEIFGWYHKDPGEADRRIEHFKQYGYDCLVLWAEELNGNNIQVTVEKIKQFEFTET